MNRQGEEARCGEVDPRESSTVEVVHVVQIG